MKLFVCALLVAGFAFGYPMTPNPNASPGHKCSTDDRDFSEYRYDEHIPYCDRNVSSATKKRIYEKYQIPTAERNQYTIDHLIPLSVGGSNAVTNLWPEHKRVKALRPELEMKIYTQLREGEISQETAIRIIVNAKFHPAKQAPPTPAPAPAPNVPLGYFDEVAFESSAVQ